jgi:hypothetical protein
MEMEKEKEFSSTLNEKFREIGQARCPVSCLFRRMELLIGHACPSPGSAAEVLVNPSMPMRMHFVPAWFREIQKPMPNLVMRSVPGYESLVPVLFCILIASSVLRCCDYVSKGYKFECSSINSTNI